MNTNAKNLFLPGVLVAMFLGGTLFLDKPYEVQREPQTKRRAFERDSLQDIGARLWQDPLAVVYDAFERDHGLKSTADKREKEENHSHASQTAANSHDVKLLAREIDQFLSVEGASSTLWILAASIQGSPYAEEAELRRRKRYAVIAGLSEGGFVPMNADYLGYFDLHLGHSNSQVKTTTLVVPFEWFKKTESGTTETDSSESGYKELQEEPELGDRVLVLWLNDAQMIAGFQERLNQILSSLLGFVYLKQSFTAEKTLCKGKINISLLGPYGSGILQAILDEPRWEQSNDHPFDRFTVQKDKIKKESIKTRGFTNRENLSSISDQLANKLTKFIDNDFNKREKNIKISTNTKQKFCQAIHSFFNKQCHRNFREGETYLFRELILALKEEEKEVLNSFHKIFEEWIHDSEYYFDGLIIPVDLKKFKINVFSSHATAIPSIIEKCLNNKCNAKSDNERQIIRNMFSNDSNKNCKKFSNILFKSFESTVAFDVEMVEVLYKEIEKRKQKRILPLSKTQGELIITIAERDSLYARKLPKAFEDINSNKGGKYEIKKLTYLRGLDGVIPNSNISLKEKSENKIPLFKNNVEYAVGDSQLDYTRRLVNQIKEFKQGNDYRVSAIAVLGSDLYDKLIILQALKSHFPETLFLTTDLDARLYHPSQYRWTRNLLIASSYGLWLNQDLQGETPIFRDNYQTATFAATQLALGRLTTTRKSLTNPTPRIFEIARGGAYDLSVENTNIWPALKDNIFVRLLEKETWWFWLFSISLVISITFISYNQIRKTFFNRNENTLNWTWQKIILFPLWFIPTWIITLYGTFVIILLASIDHNSRNGEPFEIVMGISMWPSIVVGWLASMLCLSFIKLSINSLQKNEDEINSKYFLPQKQEEHQSKYYIFINFIKSIFVRSQKNSNSQKIIEHSTAGRIWQKYRKKPVKLTAFIISLFIWFLLYFASLSTIRHKPLRGEIVWWTEELIFFIFGMLFTYLVILGCRQTLECIRFIKKITNDSEPKVKNEVGWGSSATRVPFNKNLPESMIWDELDLSIITDRTKPISNLILYPFAAFFAIWLSQIILFDDFNQPLYVQLYFFTLLSLCVLCAIQLRTVAEKSRERILEQIEIKNSMLLNSRIKISNFLHQIKSAIQQEKHKNIHEKILGLKNEIEPQTFTSKNVHYKVNIETGISTDSIENLQTGIRLQHSKNKLLGIVEKLQSEQAITRYDLNQIEELKETVRSHQEGTFSPWSKHPILRAILIPIGGVGSITILEYLLIFL